LQRAIYDPKTGSLVDPETGLVLEERMVDVSEPEYRAYDSEQAARRQHYTELLPSVHDYGLGTVRVRGDSRIIGYYQTFYRVLSALGYDRLAQYASYYFRKALAESCGGLSRADVVCYSLMALRYALADHGVFLPFRTLVKMANRFTTVTSRRMWNASKLFQRLFGPPRADIKRMIHGVVGLLNLPDSVMYLAFRLHETLKWPTSIHYAVSLVYIAGRLLGLNVRQDDIYSITGVTQSTIRKYCRRIVEEALDIEVYL